MKITKTIKGWECEKDWKNTMLCNIDSLDWVLSKRDATNLCKETYRKYSFKTPKKCKLTITYEVQED